MAVKSDNQYGIITISNNVITNAAGIIATSCYGVVGMAIRSPKDGIVSLLKPSNLAKGIKISVSENEITVVKYRLSELIGMDVKAVNVFVESIRVNS